MIIVKHRNLGNLLADRRPLFLSYPPFNTGIQTSEVLFPPLPNMEEREFGTSLNST